MGKYNGCAAKFKIKVMNGKLFGHYPPSILDQKNAPRFGGWSLSPS
jgi:hypothetical protein